MYSVIMEINDKEYVYGEYTDRNKANEIAMEIRAQRNIEASVYETTNEERE